MPNISDLLKAHLRQVKQRSILRDTGVIEQRYERRAAMGR